MIEENEGWVEHLLENFDTLASTPEAVKRLEEKILEWAVQGKLGTQEAGDEPASELLKRIKTEKAKLVESKIISENQPTPIKKKEEPFNLPEGWVWVRIPEIAHNWGQKKPDKLFSYIDVSSIDNQRGKIADEFQVLEPKDAPSRARKIVKNGTVIYSTVRPYLLNIAVIDREIDPSPIVSTAFYILHPFDGIIGEYLYYYLRSKPFIKFVEGQMTGMAYPAISDSKMELGLVPIPPTHEQQRIVAKVEKLLFQVRTFGEKLQKSQEELKNLNQAALGHLLAAKDPQEFEERRRFIAENFETLYSDQQNVGPLKHAILELAVRGKLVRQEEGDEPARELLKRIKAEKERLAEEGKIARERPLPAIKEEEKPFELPRGWEWTKLSDVSEIIMGQSPPGNSYNDHGEGVPLINGPVEFNPGPFDKIKKVKFTTSPSKICKEGDLIICVRGATTGRTNIAGFEACIGRGVAAIRGFINQSFINYFMLYYRYKLLNLGTGSTFPSVSYDKIASINFPLPPLAEQRRIILENEALINLCDELACGLRNAERERERWVEAVLAN
jgi:type I restriction enzyme, S subunit